MPFLGFAYAGLVFCRKSLLEGSPCKKTLFNCLIAGVLTGYASMIRINGLALFPAFVLALAYQNRRRFSLAIAQSGMAFLGIALIIGFFQLIVCIPMNIHYLPFVLELFVIVLCTYLFIASQGKTKTVGKKVKLILYPSVIISLVFISTASFTPASP